MSADPSPLGSLPGFQFRRLSQQSLACFHAEVQADGLELTPMQFAVLCTLRERPGIDQASLAAAIGFDRVTTGGVIARLEKRGCLERGVSVADRRARVLQLTPAGTGLLEAAWPAVARAQAAVTSPLAPEERDELLRLVGKLTARD